MGHLKRLGRYRYGGFPESRVRFQGALGARQVYGLDFTFVPPRPERRYEALDRGDVDVTDVLTTEAELAERSRYRVLRDSEGIFGVQNIVPAIDRDALRAHGPRLAETLNAVTAELTNAALRDMNGAWTWAPKPRLTSPDTFCETAGCFDAPRPRSFRPGWDQGE